MRGMSFMWRSVCLMAQARMCCTTQGSKRRFRICDERFFGRRPLALLEINRYLWDIVRREAMSSGGGVSLPVFVRKI